MAIHTCTNATELQTAITNCVYGDEIRCSENVTFERTGGDGSWTFPVKTGYTGTETIVVTTTAAAGLPAVGERTGPTYAVKLPKLYSRQAAGYTNVPCIKVAQGAKGWVFRHLEIRQNYLGGGAHVRVGDADVNQYLKSHQPEDIVFDRIYTNTTLNPYWGQKRGFELHGVNITVKNCYCEPIGCPTNSAESSVIWMMNGYGPYTITNNRCPGGTYGIFTGGGHSNIRTIATIGASPAPTSSSVFVDWSGSEHSDADPPEVGQHISILTSTTLARHGTVTSYTPSTSNSGTIGFTYKLINGSVITETPLVGGVVRWGAIPGNISVSKNYIFKPATWIGAGVDILSVPGNAAAVAASTGTLAAGSYNARIQARVQGFQGTYTVSDATTAIAVVVNGSQKISASWDAVTGATAYRLFVQFPDTTWRYVETAGTSTTFSSPTEGFSTAAPSSGQRWHVKNLFELKCGTDVEVFDNIFEAFNKGSGAGYAFWVKSLNQPSSWPSTFNLTSNVDVHHNIIRSCHGILSVSAREDETTNESRRPGQLENFQFRHNLCYDSGIEPYAEGETTNWGISYTGGASCTFDHNTVIHLQKAAMRLLVSVAEDNYITPDFVVTNNLFIKNTEGVRGQTSGFTNTEGTTSLNNHTLGDYTFTNNAIRGGSSGSYPAGVGNLFPNQAAFEAYFTDYANKDFSLAVGSAAIGAGTGGSDLGADVATILANTALVITGAPATPPVEIVTVSPLADAPEDMPYTFTMTATDGTEPYVWSLDSGSLPTGLSLSADGIISGTPTTPGVYTFTIKVTDFTTATDTVALSLTINLVEPDVPQRWYFPSNIPADDTSLGVSSGWSLAPDVSDRYGLISTKFLSPTDFVQRTNTGGASNSYRCLAQYVTAPLAAQEIRGTIKGVMRCNENNVGLSATLAICVRIINSSGEEMAVLTNGGDPTPLASDDSTTTPPEFHAGTHGSSNRSRMFQDSAEATEHTLVTYACSDRDRFVVEVGYKYPGASSSASGSVMIGDDTGVDLDHENSTSISLADPWIELSRTLEMFVPPEEGIGTGITTMLLGV